jgi:16S rRNA (uracil1498-N3)-methyltransferase
MAQEIRLYTTQKLEEKIEITLDAEQSHYLAHVMRCKLGDYVSIFNGKDGQWQTEITSINKKSIAILPLMQTRQQAASPDLWLVFSPIKNKTELVVEKAVELGVSKILPIVTRHCVVRSVNIEKLTIYAISAAEQCERLDIPLFETHKDLSYLLGEWDKDRILLYGDETGGGISLTKILQNIEKNQKVSVLIGPEGGFAADELAMLRACNFTKAFGMGGRILRADTAAVAALACVQAQLGDWDEQPHFIGKAK